VLESSGFLTQKVLQERFYFQDARQSLYGLNDNSSGVVIE
jgi:hypothetical protein